MNRVLIHVQTVCNDRGYDEVHYQNVAHDGTVEVVIVDDNTREDVLTIPPSWADLAKRMNLSHLVNTPKPHVYYGLAGLKMAPVGQYWWRRVNKTTLVDLCHTDDGAYIEPTDRHQRAWLDQAKTSNSAQFRDAVFFGPITPPEF